MCATVSLLQIWTTDLETSCGISGIQEKRFRLSDAPAGQKVLDVRLDTRFSYRKMRWKPVSQRPQHPKDC